MTELEFATVDVAVNRLFIDPQFPIHQEQIREQNDHSSQHQPMVRFSRIGTFRPIHCSPTTLTAAMASMMPSRSSHCFIVRKRKAKNIGSDQLSSVRDIGGFRGVNRTAGFFRILLWLTED